jgi:hypothetical protein
MADKSKTRKNAKITEVADELSQEQLDLVAGGGNSTSSVKLFEAVSTGKHIPKLKIE